MTSPFNIQRDNLQSTEIAQFLQEHLDDMHAESPPESVHALDLSALRQPNIHFWSMRDGLGGAVVACGALKLHNHSEAEIKSMRTAASFRGRGIATQMLNHIEQAAKANGVQTLYLETGSPDYFAPARALYSKHGFTQCGPFADYAEDPYSVFMSKKLE